METTRRERRSRGAGEEMLGGSARAQTVIETVSETAR
jgi:hypothetical protein